MDELLACALWSFSAKFMPPACRAVAQIVRHDQTEDPRGIEGTCMHTDTFILSCLHMLLVAHSPRVLRGWMFFFWFFLSKRFCVDCLHSKAHLTWSSQKKFVPVEYPV